MPEWQHLDGHLIYSWLHEYSQAGHELVQLWEDEEV